DQALPALSRYFAATLPRLVLPRGAWAPRGLLPPVFFDREPWSVKSSRDFPAAKASLSQRSEEHTSELQSQSNLVCRLLLETKTHHRMAVWQKCKYNIVTLQSCNAVMVQYCIDL